MQLSLVLKVVAFGLLAYICTPAAICIVLTVLINLPGITPSAIPPLGLITFFCILRFGLFAAVGFVVGKRVAGARIGNAALAGGLLAIGVMLVDVIVILLVLKFRSGPYIPNDGPCYRLPVPIWGPWALFGLQVGLATVGGWIASRRRPVAVRRLS